MAKSNEALKEQLAKRAPLKPGKDPAATVRQMLLRMGPESRRPSRSTWTQIGWQGSP